MIKQKQRKNATLKLKLKTTKHIKKTNTFCSISSNDASFVFE